MIPVSLGFPPVEDWPHHVPHVHHTQCLRQMLHWSLSKRPLSKKIWLRGSWVSFSTCSIHALVFYCVSCVSFNHTAILTSNILQAKLTHPLAFHLSIWSILWCIDTPPSFDTYIAINKINRACFSTDNVPGCMPTSAPKIPQARDSDRESSHTGELWRNRHPIWSRKAEQQELEYCQTGSLWSS